VQSSLLEAQIFMLDFQAARWLQKREVPRQAGNNHPTSIPTGVFATADGHINIAAAGQPMWLRLCEAIGAGDLAKKPEYATPQLRSSNRDACNADLQRRLEGKTSAEWIARLNEAGVPTGPIYAIDQVFADAQVRHTGIVQRIEKEGGEGKDFVGQPVKLSRTPSRARRMPPERGEHTEEVLAEFGYGAGEIEALRRAKAI
jgi:formyl-CoA transferase